jgi:hypothetical protein
MAALRYIDAVLVIVAVPILLVVGAPALGTAVGAGGWILQRLIQVADRAWTSRLEEPRRRVGISLFEAFARIWLLAGAIVVAGAAGSRRDGLTAAIVIFCAYSIAFAVRVASGPPQERAQ